MTARMCAVKAHRRRQRRFDTAIAASLFAMWWNRQVQTQVADKSKIKTYRRNCIGDYVEVHDG